MHHLATCRRFVCGKVEKLCKANRAAVPRLFDRFERIDNWKVHTYPLSSRQLRGVRVNKVVSAKFKT